MKRQMLLLFAPLFSLTVYAQSPWHSFSDDSPWNQRIAADAQVDSSSRVMIEDLSIGGLYVNIDDWSVPVYYIDAGVVPRVSVINSRPGIYGRGFAEPNLIPILPDFIPSPPVGPESDNHLCIVDTVRMVEWDMWAARKDSSGAWTTGLGAVTDLRSSGVEKPWYEQQRELDAHRSRAGGFPLIAGLIRPEEIRAGRIDHALVFAYQRGRSEFFVPPASTAQATFMEMNNRSGIPMGGRIQLDPSVAVDSLPLTPAGKIIARALQEYGAFNGDYAGATVLYADNSPAALRQWKGVLEKTDLLKVFTSAFIKKHLRVIKIGSLLPGQNLKNGRGGFLEFTFPGVLRTSLDWLTASIVCEVNDTIGLAGVRPVFRTVMKNSTVFVRRVRQKSGVTQVDLRRRIRYVVNVPKSGSTIWTVEVRNISAHDLPQLPPRQKE